jgi:antitoxin YefM
MNAINYTDLRKNLKEYLDQVYQDHEPLIITRKNNQNIVVISIEDYNSLVETNYLLSNPSNAKRLLNSLEKARSGKVEKKELIEE